MKIVKVKADWDKYIICEKCGKRLHKNEYAYVLLWGLVVLCKECANKIKNKKLTEYLNIDV